jgi:hypothetical protein
MVKRESLAVFELLCVIVLILGTLAGCGGSQEKDQGKQEGTTPEQNIVEETTTETTPVESGAVVRVSGTPGTAYSGTFGTVRNVQVVDDATVGTEPEDYVVGNLGPEDDQLNASFSKTQPGGETLQVEILVDGKSVAQGETSAELGVATANYVPEEALPEKTLPKEGEK